MIHKWSDPDASGLQICKKTTLLYKEEVKK